MSAKESSSGGIGLSGLLAVLFIGLKLCHVIDWSWLWVLSPLWIPFGVLLAFFVLFGFVVGMVAMVSGVHKAWGKR